MYVLTYSTCTCKFKALNYTLYFTLKENSYTKNIEKAVTWYK